MTTTAILTPSGRGAVASIAVWGERAAATVDELFSSSSGARLVNAGLGRILFGQWRSSGEEVVVSRRAEDEIEIHCHGGQAAVQAVLASLLERGCRQVSWTKWAGRQAAGSLVAEALEALPQATTLRCAGILLDQLHGALKRELDSFAALLESPGQTGWHEARDRLRRLVGSYQVGKHLAAPFQIVIAGRPNVGKSSLINALAGYERSIVFNQPGTTRDVVTLRTAIAGWPVEVSDTAGLRASGDALEAAGVHLASERMTAADLVLLVFDASQPWQPDDDELAAQWPSALVVYNKCDLDQPAPTARPGCIISAQTGQGIDNLLEIVAGRLVPEPPSAGAPIAFTALQEQFIHAALHCLECGDRLAAAGQLKALHSTSANVYRFPTN